MNETLELIVLEGRKQGASVTLPSGDSVITVGVGYDCDVVLGLPGLYQSADGDDQPNGSKIFPVVELIINQGQLALKVLSGNAVVGDQVIEAGSDIAIDKYVPIKLQDNIFAVQVESTQSINSPQFSKSSTSVSRNNESIDKQMINSDELEYSLTHPEVAESAPQKNKRILAGALQSLAGLIILGGAVMAYPVIGKQSTVTIEEVLTGVKTDLAAAGFEDLTVALHEDSSIKVNGYLENRSELQRAREQIQTPDVVRWDINLGESLAESVGSVFRVSGLVAEVALVSEGVVSVNTSTNDLELLQQIEQSVYTDVPELQNLELVNDEPEIEIEAPAPDPIESEPGKRIVMIVASDPTYIQTEDGSRYFEGSILPSGHTIIAILDETVHLQINNEQVELTF